ncbi:hypothetical protein LOTGIDRAFT_168766 [Lottia gigantea]|uniref:CUB domain-containing protein n=1 Tax=Lottia gigantea TaxID=225164 RepID=V3ZTR7_LOTGI|nr:hypothetical protein LOTGIDRAFT_168766 [Lottia gigantea]ESO84321.1 hypothetical protein LOTGIDRAFT_168766 [Lottia gigantea]
MEMSQLLSPVLLFITLFFHKTLCTGLTTYYMETNCGKALDLEYFNEIQVKAQPSSKSSGNLNSICTVTISTARSAEEGQYSKICVHFDSLKVSDKCDSSLFLTGVDSSDPNNAMYFLCKDDPPSKEVCSVANTLDITVSRGSQRASDVQFSLKATNKYPEIKSHWQEERFKDLEERQESSTIISIVCGAVVGAMFLIVMVTVCIMYQRNQARARNSSTSNQNGDNPLNPSAPPNQGVGYTAVPRHDTATPLPGNHPVPEYHPMHVLPSHNPSEASAPSMRIPGGFQQYTINDANLQRNYAMSNHGSIGPQGSAPGNKWNFGRDQGPGGGPGGLYI